MKKLILIALLLVAAFAFSQERGFGIGLMLGEPTGISLKTWTSPTNAIDAGLAWSFYKNPALHMHADYLWHDFDLIKTKERIPVYYGVGGRIRLGNKDNGRIGVRGVFGIGFLLKQAPIDFFIELAPILDLIPGTTLNMNGGIGARYFFE
ncbi:MAG: hypothetical protein QME58_05965 [Bacteroidota bacterium]|nr:hypothetical protein [Bacteroidota bacterium]